MATAEADLPGMAINPISAENIFIPGPWRSLAKRSPGSIFGLLRPVEPVGCLILVSREWHKETPGTSDEPYGIAILRHVFIQAKQRIELREAHANWPKQ